jgi:hypothetical protein
MTPVQSALQDLSIGTLKSSSINAADSGSLHMTRNG